MKLYDLKNIFYYDPTSPSGLRWKVNRYRGKSNTALFKAKGDMAGGKMAINKPYYRVHMSNETLLVHRIIWALFSNLELNEFGTIDHIDGNHSNNLLENLRCVTYSENACNRKIKSTNTTGVTGVSKYVKQYGNNPEITYYRVMWKDGSKMKTKDFSSNVYGLEKAFELACKFREEMLIKHKSLYTERHGV